MPEKYSRTVAVIGGGAAGFFAAINIAEKNSGSKVIILEKTGKLLQKVKISGGGRCNVTNACFDPKELSSHYPRGGKQLIPLFRNFHPEHTMEWFRSRGVKLKTEPDKRVFPESDSSQTIIDCFLKQAKKHDIDIKLHHDVVKIIPLEGNKWMIHVRDHDAIECDVVAVATGGTPSVWKMLSVLGHSIIPPVPSLFTFNINDVRLKGLEGVAFPNVRCRISGTQLNSEGPLLITHWGLSGPAILKLSAFAARDLSDKKYKFGLSINFSPELNFDSVRAKMLELKSQSKKRMVKNLYPVSLPSSYWKSILNFCNIGEISLWQDLGKKQVNKIAEEISNAVFQVDGKSTFKEEFVTSGGVDLGQVEMNTLESRLFPGLYFAGEALNIDGVTGGFNFQAAWTTAWLVSEGLR